ncbi:MAG: zinc-ribbon domain-containing protein [Lachnospiraceae bacterium]|nr:zinc-ribbon domain-containing protein [Lachnospiraceae bacterium]
MSRTCTNCGADIPDGNIFCTNCGTKVDAMPAAPVFTEPEQPSAPVSTESELTLQPEQPAPAPVYSEPAPEFRPEPKPEPAPQPTPVYTEPKPAPAYRPEPAPAPRTNTEAAFGVAPAAPGANYSKPAPEPYPQNPPYQPAPVQYEEDPAESKVVSTAGFFWLSFLYCIPVIGFIAAIIIACAAKNLNIKHHACAFLVAILVAFVIMIILCILIVIAVTQLGIDFGEYLRKLEEALPYISY